MYVHSISFICFQEHFCILHTLSEMHDLPAHASRVVHNALKLCMHVFMHSFSLGMCFF